MSKDRWKMHPDVERELNATGLPWSIRAGTKHMIVLIEGQATTILPRRYRDSASFATRNSIGDIRRKVRQIKQSQGDPA